MQAGLIYVLINPCMTGFVKIGMTTRTAEERARELSVGTGIPSPYAVAYEEAFSDCDAAEGIIHERLDKFRFNQDREFFHLPVKDAIRAVADLAEEFHERYRAAEAKAATQRGAGQVNSTDAMSLPPRRVSPPRVPSVRVATVSCPSCSNCYKVTLKRGERQASCPLCHALSSLEVEW